MAASLLTELAVEDNVVCSPFSVRLALAMLLPGARGETRAQIATCAGTDDAAVPAALLRTLRAGGGWFRRSAAIRLSIANGAFLQPGFPVLPAYREAVEGPFGAQIENLDFGDAGAAAARINEWVEKATERMISNFLAAEAISGLTRLVLVNAVYFLGEWEVPFERHLTRPHRFHPLEGAAYTVPMMCETRVLPYAVDDEAGIEAIRIPYRKTSFVVVLPRRGRFIEVARSFGEDHLASLRFSEREVALLLPRFELESHLSLAGVLSRLGVRIPFDRSSDFGALTDHPEGLFVEAIEHAARIGVDEQGTEAAAATALMAVPGAALPSRDPPLLFAVDRPFHFFIHDDSTGTVLFAGRCTAPKAIGG